MSVRISFPELETAKKDIAGYEYAYLMMIGGLELKKTPDPGDILWEECLEARFFSADRELHIFEDDMGLWQAVLTEDIEDGQGVCRVLQKEGTEEKDATVEENFRYFALSPRFKADGKTCLAVKEYLSFDEDGQVTVYKTRLLGLTDRAGLAKTGKEGEDDD